MAKDTKPFFHRNGQLEHFTDKDFGKGTPQDTCGPKKDFTFMSGGRECHRGELFQKVSSGVRKQSAVKQRVFPRERV